TEGTTASRSTTYTIGHGPAADRGRAVDKAQRAEAVGRRVPVDREDLPALRTEPRGGLLAGRDRDQGQDHQHQPPGRGREYREDRVAERAPVGQRAGGPSRSGWVRLCRGAHDD